MGLINGSPWGIMVGIATVGVIIIAIKGIIGSGKNKSDNVDEDGP